jgi:hypothetical protein
MTPLAFLAEVLGIRVRCFPSGNVLGSFGTEQTIYVLQLLLDCIELHEARRVVDGPDPMPPQRCTNCEE